MQFFDFSKVFWPELIIAVLCDCHVAFICFLNSARWKAFGQSPSGCSSHST